jgi:hypothetical protein
VEFHPIAEVWPLFDDEALQALAEDIKANGLDLPIVTYDGKILDGRNCYLACQKAGVEPQYDTYEGSDPIRKALSLNEQRRHMDASQRALVAEFRGGYCPTSRRHHGRSTGSGPRYGVTAADGKPVPYGNLRQVGALIEGSNGVGRYGLGGHR